MTPTWQGDAPPDPRPRGVMGFVRILLRGLPLSLVIFGGLASLQMLRLLERPVFGVHRPWTPFITQFVCRAALLILGLRMHVSGQRAPKAPLVANHSSWIDIFALNAAARVYFVAKSEVAGWPGIGWLARATGTVFVRRVRGDAARQRDMFASRLAAGHALLFFPEGTSTDGRRVLAFKPTLFAAIFDAQDRQVQPVTVIYTAPIGEDVRFYGWWGDMEFAGHLLSVLAAPGGGTVEIAFHDPMPVTEYSNRKELASAAETAVRMHFLDRMSAHPASSHSETI